MNDFDSQDKKNKKVDKKLYKKNRLDDETRDQSRLNKSFKQRKKELEGDTEWENWEEDYYK
jgi:hypothetical protein